MLILQPGACCAQACIGSGAAYAARFVCSLDGSPALAFLWEHRVRSRALFPGAAMFEAAYAAASALLGAKLLHSVLRSDGHDY